MEAVARRDIAAYSCPVCLETLVQPVAFKCGHPVCLECCSELVKKSKTPLCPMCRGPVFHGGRYGTNSSVTFLPALNALAKAYDPCHFAARKQASK